MMYNDVNETHEFFVNIKGSYLEELFDLVFEVYSKHGSEISRNWTDWPRLDQYYPSEILGNYIETTEDDSLKRFCNGDGSHCIYRLGVKPRSLVDGDVSQGSRSDSGDRLSLVPHNP